MSRTSGEETVRANGSGTYDHVDTERFEVNGTASVREDVVAREVSVNGSLDVGGTLESEEVDLDGSASFDGDCSVDHLDADGSTVVEGNLDGHDIESDGATTVEGNLVANEAAFDGSTMVEGLADVTELSVDGTGTFGDIIAETLGVEGALDADDVRAERFELGLGGDSAVDAIRAGGVEVSRREGGGSLLARLLDRGDPTLAVDLVEGDHVELDATAAETVAAETVVLGADAEVGVVYADDLDAAAGATVGEVREYAAYESADADGDDIETNDTGDIEPAG
jgi:cytoskeletal protein CcmA (bactofilin family)